MVRLPKQDDFQTFCWGEIIEKLRNTYKLKDLFNFLISTINSTKWLLFLYSSMNVSYSNHILQILNNKMKLNMTNYRPFIVIN